MYAGSPFGNRFLDGVAHGSASYFALARIQHQVSGPTSVSTDRSWFQVILTGPTQKRPAQQSVSPRRQNWVSNDIIILPDRRVRAGQFLIAKKQLWNKDYQK